MILVTWEPSNFCGLMNHVHRLGCKGFTVRILGDPRISQLADELFDCAWQFSGVHA